MFVLAIPLPYVANQLGWVTAEVGRQPWIVYGLLRTSDALSKAVAAGQTLGSIIMFVLIYAPAVRRVALCAERQNPPRPGTGHPAGPATTAGSLADVAGLRAGTGRQPR